VSDDPKPREVPEDVPASQEIDEFFQRLPANFRWPKPNAAAIAAAAESIQRASAGEAPLPDVVSPDSSSTSSDVCSGCGSAMPQGARFCHWCGLASGGAVASVPAQHIHHHHYHHFAAAAGASSPGGAAEVDARPAQGRATGGPKPGGRAEAAARQVVQEWAQACNTRHIDDLVDLYSPDATVIRSSVPPVRSLAAIREFLISLLEAGLGEVEMESLRVDVLGDIALDLGRCKMLVPVAMGKRREERGKYLVVLVRQPAGTWKILADCWSSDLAVNAPPPESAPRKANEPAPAPSKRK
jgi:ketosteroid isomerase-like protein